MLESNVLSMNITDGYSHCGLSKWRPLEDVDRVMDRFHVERAVLAQHLGEFDNTYIEMVVRARPERFAGVFLVDTDSADARDAHHQRKFATFHRKRRPGDATYRPL